ncbi:MAG: NUDIX domain-containing protein [Cellulomonas sp.]
MIPSLDLAVREREFLAILAQWSPGSPAQRELKGEYEAFLCEARAAALDRDDGPEHLTGSCFVLTPDLSAVLLCFHRKGQFWVQLGGHIEADDASVAAAAYREAREEGGITNLRPCGNLPLDLDRHALSGSFGTCRVHWDVGFVAFADADAVPAVSAESEAVAWFAVDALPANVPPGFPARLRTILDELATRQER